MIKKVILTDLSAGGMVLVSLAAKEKEAIITYSITDTHKW